MSVPAGQRVRPALANALRGAVAEALAARETGEPRTILFGVSGHGHFDMAAFDAFLAGRLADYELNADELEAALSELPHVTL